MDWSTSRDQRKVTIDARRVAQAAVWVLGLSLIAVTLASLAAARDGTGSNGDSGGQIYRVCPGGPPACDTTTIQAAVDQAAAGDEIQIAGGAYSQLTVRAGITQVVYLSKTLTLRGGFATDNWDHPDPVANPTRLDARGGGRVLYVSGEIAVRLAGLELTGGDAAGMGGFGPIDAGGAVYVTGATVALEASRLYSNTAGYGGALFALGGRPTISDSAIISNSAVAGGGLYLQQCGHSIVAASLVAGNEATGTSYDEGGGGLYVSGGDVTVIGSQVRDNTAGEYGGGLFVMGGALHCSSSSIAGNTAGGYGGGMTLRWSEATLTGNLIDGNQAKGGGGFQAYLSDLILTGNSITHNQATEECGGAGHMSSGTARASGNLVSANWAQLNGGGLAFCQSNAVLNGNTVISNTAGEYGGGIFVSQSRGTLEANVVRGNDAHYGGGLGLRETSTVTATNTLIADNAAGGEGGGIYVESSSLEALHTTLARSNGPSALCVTRHAGEGSYAALVNTILVSHTLGVTVSEGSYATLEATLWGAGDWANDRDWAGHGTLMTGTLNLWQEPGFVIGDYYLGLNSAAVDAGIDAGVGRDIDGQPRPHYDGYDLGADEWWPIMVVKRAMPEVVEREQLVTYTVWLTNATELAAPVYLTDLLPAEVHFVGPLELSHGEGGYAAGVITWTGTLGPAGVGWLSWRVLIAPETPYSTTIINRALINDPYGTYSTEGAQIFLPPRQVYLPLALR